MGGGSGGWQGLTGENFMLKLTKTLTSTCATDHNQSYDQGRGATELLGNCFIVTSGNPKH